MQRGLGPARALSGAGTRELLSVGGLDIVAEGAWGVREDLVVTVQLYHLLSRRGGRHCMPRQCSSTSHPLP